MILEVWPTWDAVEPRRFECADFDEEHGVLRLYAGPVDSEPSHVIRDYAIAVVGGRGPGPHGPPRLEHQSAAIRVTDAGA